MVVLLAPEPSILADDGVRMLSCTDQLRQLTDSFKHVLRDLGLEYLELPFCKDWANSDRVTKHPYLNRGLVE